MTEKRYFKKMWEEEFYIFDSDTISESDFEEKLEYQDYKAFEDSMMGDEVVNRLNKLHEENKTFREALKELKEIGDYQAMRIRELDDENQKLEKENERLKRINKGQELEIVRLHKLADAMSGALRELGVYDVYDKQQIENRKKENEQLKQSLERKQRRIDAYEDYIKTLKEDGVLDD